MLYPIDAVQSAVEVHYNIDPNRLQTPLSIAMRGGEGANQPSSRTALRRMRTEIQAPLLKTEPMDQLENWIEEFNEALRRADLAAAFRLIDQMEALSRQMLDEAVQEHAEVFGQFKLGIDLVSDGAYEEARAYLMALNHDPSAVETCDAGFKLIHHGLLEVASHAGEFGFSVVDLETLQNLTKRLHFLYRGLLKTALSDREGAVADLKIGYADFLNTELSFFNLEGELDQAETLFFIKMLEKRLHGSLLPENIEMDIQNPLSLFLNGRYEEALALVQTDSSFQEDPYLEMFQAACYALMGQYDLSLDLVKESGKDFEESDLSAFASAIYFLKGDQESARELLLQFDSPLSYFLLLAMSDSNGSNPNRTE